MIFFKKYFINLIIVEIKSQIKHHAIKIKISVYKIVTEYHKHSFLGTKKVDQMSFLRLSSKLA